MARLSPTGAIEVAGGPVEVADLPGDPELAPLVLLHEGLGSIGLWRDLPGDLAAATSRRTIAYSRHGYGGSAPAALPRTPAFMHHEAMAVLPGLLDRLAVADPVLVGHSDGASIALIHAGTGAGTPSGLVLLAPHVVVEEHGLVGIRAVRESYRTSDLPERMARHHTDADATFWGWNDIWLAEEFRSWDIRPECAGVTCPVLLVQGTADAYGTMTQLDEIAAGVRGPVRRLELPDVGHSPHLERPAEVVAAISRFLTDPPR